MFLDIFKWVQKSRTRLTLMAHYLFFLLHQLRRHRKEMKILHAHVRCACKHDSISVGNSLEQLDVKWKVKNFIDVLVCCFLLRTALGSVTGTRQWLKQRGRCIVFDWDQLFWRTLHWTSDLKTCLIQCHNQGRDPRMNTQTRWFNIQRNGRYKEENVDRNGQNNGEMEMDSECRTCWCFFFFILFSRQTMLTACWCLSSGFLTLEPQLAVLIRLHCLKSPILTECHCSVSCPPTR